MQYWLVKSEPDAYSWDDLLEEGTGMWDGVRNYQARNNLDKMEEGDQVFFYHSGSAREIVGICEVVRSSYPDPTADSDKWSAVDFKGVRALDHPVSLDAVKEDPELAESPLVKQARLSVMQLTKESFDRILDKSKQEGHG